ncbi:ribosome maturation factor RimP [Allomeiothermus silvanus]|uniref:ribosome maturation factor RimP n=1 Tax=Allomeiothermus silvanus TaxID=52022 RepID=UPI002357412E|nr:ribosome maturation factor RimP [Allomeiothermus silvanus]MBI5813915.1 ribosome maturation factor RimP [Allomeiothermus silvanus]
MEVAQDLLGPMGYDVLEVSLKGTGNSRVLTVRLERKDEVPISVEELERASRVLGSELDRLDLIESAYRLEVESPGPDRPLLTPRHFERFAGLKAKVRSPEGNFTGRIEGVSEDTVTFLVGKELRTLKIGEFKANLAEWPKTPR